MKESETWYYNQDGVAVGPFSAAIMAEHFQEGAFEPDTLVWEPSMESWQPLNAVPLALSSLSEVSIVQPGPLRMPLPVKKPASTTKITAIPHLQPVNHRPAPKPHAPAASTETPTKSSLLKRLLGMKN